MRIIIPAYEPDLRLLKLIDEIIANSNYEIIIINDGSSSNYSSIFEQAGKRGCIILQHPRNLGKGAALKSAFQYLLDNECTEDFVCADCDGQHTWQNIKAIANALEKSSSSLILGCREFVGDVPLKSMIGNKLTRFIFSLITGYKINDTQTGLRGFRCTMLPWLVSLKGNRYEYEMNQLLQAKKAGYTFHSIPIDTIYENQNKGSHFHPIRDSVRVYLPILKFSISSITSAAIDFCLLFLLKLLTNNLLVAVVGARAVSSLCNYFFNKHYVFEAGTHKKSTTFIKYYLLVSLILCLNYIVLSFLYKILSLPLLLSKILTEALLFGFSYLMQHKFIFYMKDAK